MGLYDTIIGGNIDYEPGTVYSGAITPKKDNDDKLNNLTAGAAARLATGPASIGYELNRLGDAEKYSNIGLGRTVNLLREQREGNLESVLADNQSNLQKTKNALARTLVNELAIGTVKGFSDLFDITIGSAINFATETEQDYENPVSKFLAEKQKEFEEYTPIYSDPYRNTIIDGGFTNWGWWMENLPSIVSSLTLLVPGEGMVKGVSLLGKAGKAGKFGKGVKRAITLGRRAIGVENAERVEQMAKLGISAGTSRLVENYQEANQVYQDMYKDAANIFKAMNDEEYNQWVERHKDDFDEEFDFTDKDAVAKNIAKRSATETFIDDLWNVGFDVFELYGLKNVTRIMNAPMRASIRRKQLDSIKYMNKSPEEIQKLKAARKWYEKTGETIGDWIYGSKVAIGAQLSEGVEEAINYISQQEGMHLGNVILEKENPTPTMKRFLNEYMLAPELYDSAFWGVLGGVVFQGLGSQFKRAENAINAMTDTRYKENDKTKEQIKKPSLIENWSLPEIKMRIANIDSRTNLINDAFASIQAIKDGTYKDENGNTPKTDSEKEVARRKVFNNLVTDVLLNAQDAGNYDLAVEFLTNDNVIKSLVDNGLTTEEGAKETKAAIQNKVEKLDYLYNKHFKAIDNALRGKTVVAGINLEDMPIEYFKIVARTNIKHELKHDDFETTAKGVEDEIAKLEKQFADDIAGKNYRQNIEHAVAVLNYVEAIKSLHDLENDKDNKKDHSLLTQRLIKEQKKKIVTLEKYITRDITGNDTQIDKMSRFLSAYKQAKNVLIGRETDTARRKEIAKTYEEFDNAVLNNDINFFKRLNDVFRPLLDSETAIDDLTSAIHQSKILDQNLDRNLRNDKKFYTEVANFSQDLANNYAKATDLHLAALMEKDMIATKTSDIIDVIDGIHNIFGSARWAAIENANENIVRLAKEYGSENIIGYIGSKFRENGGIGYVERNNSEIEGISERHKRTLDESLEILNLTSAPNLNIIDQLKETLDKVAARDYAEVEDIDEIYNNETKESSTKNKNPSESENKNDMNSSSEELPKVNSEDVSHEIGTFNISENNKKLSRPMANITIDKDGNIIVKQVKSDTAQESDYPIIEGKNGTIEIDLKSIFKENPSNNIFTTEELVNLDGNTTLDDNIKVVSNPVLSIDDDGKVAVINKGQIRKEGEEEVEVSKEEFNNALKIENHFGENQMQHYLNEVNSKSIEEVINTASDLNGDKRYLQDLYDRLKKGESPIPAKEISSTGEQNNELPKTAYLQYMSQIEDLIKKLLKGDIAIDHIQSYIAERSIDLNNIREELEQIRKDFAGRLDIGDVTRGPMAREALIRKGIEIRKWALYIYTTEDKIIREAISDATNTVKEKIEKLIALKHKPSPEEVSAPVEDVNVKGTVQLTIGKFIKDNSTYDENAILELAKQKLDGIPEEEIRREIESLRNWSKRRATAKGYDTIVNAIDDLTKASDFLDRAIKTDENVDAARKQLDTAFKLILDEYAKHCALDIYNGITYINLTNLLSYINSATDNEYTAEVVFQNILKVINQPKSGYKVVDINHTENEFIERAKMTADELAEKEIDSTIQRINVASYINYLLGSEMPEDELDNTINKIVEVINNANIGDKLTYQTTIKGRVEIKLNNVIIGSMPVPIINEQGTHYTMINEGWLTDVPIDENINSNFYDLLETIFVKEDGERIVELLRKADHTTGKEFNAAADIIINEIRNLDGINASELMIDTNNSGNVQYDNTDRVKHLIKLYKYVKNISEKSAISSKENLDSQPIMRELQEISIQGWMSKLKESYDTIINLANDSKFDIEIDNITEGGPIRTKDYHPISEAIGEKHKGHIQLAVSSITEPGLLHISGAESEHDYGIYPGRTRIIINSRLPWKIAAFPARFNSDNFKNNEAGQIADEIINEFDKILNTWGKNPAKTNLNELEDFIKKIAGRKGGNQPFVYGIRITKNSDTNHINLECSTENGTFYINFWNKASYNGVEKIASNVEIIGEHNVRILKGQSYTYDENGNEKSEPRKQVLDVLRKSLHFNLNPSYVISDNNKTLPLNGVAKRNKEGKFSVKIGDNPEHVFDSFADFVIGQNLINVNTMQNSSGSNIVSTIEGGNITFKINPKISTPVEKTIPKTTTSTSVRNLGDEALNILERGGEDIGLQILSLVLNDNQLKNLNNSKILKEITPKNIIFVPNYNHIAAYEPVAKEINGVHVPAGYVVISDTFIDLLNNKSERAADMHMEAARALIHEGIHDLLTKDENAKAITAIKEVFDKFVEANKSLPEDDFIRTFEYVKYYDEKGQVHDLSGRYYTNGEINLKGLEEFLVESLTRPALMKRLNEISQNGRKIGNERDIKSTKGNLFQRLLSALAELLGIKINKNSLLSKEYEIFKDLFKTSIIKQNKNIAQQLSFEFKENEVPITTKFVEDKKTEKQQGSSQSKNEIKNDEEIEDEDEIEEDENDEESYNFDTDFFSDFKDVYTSSKSIKDRLPIENRKQFNNMLNNGLINIICK